MYITCDKCGGLLEKPRRIKGRNGTNKCQKCQHEAALIRDKVYREKKKLRLLNLSV